MIRAVTDSAALYRALGDDITVYTEKIRSLAEAYGFGYDFCRFWVQDGGAVIGSYYGEATAADCGHIGKARSSELAAFLCCGQFSGVLMPYSLYEKTGSYGAEKLLLMRAGDGIKKTDDIYKVRTGTAVSIGEIYEIAKSGFDIDFNKWYTDTSHMLRHGTVRLYALGSSACAVRMFASGGISYLSYICTVPEERGKGLAGSLLAHICAEESACGNEVFLFCAGELEGFYHKCGFEPAGEAVCADARLRRRRWGCAPPSRASARALDPNDRNTELDKSLKRKI